MTNKTYLIFEGLMLAALAGLIAAFQNDASTWAIVLKTLASLCFVLTGACGWFRQKDNRKFSQFMLAAFACSMAGDVLLAFDKGQGILFVLGVASFAAAHVLFSIAFCRISAVTKKDILGTVAVFIILMLILLLGTFDFQGLFPVLAGYAAIISFMVVKALSFKRLFKRQGKNEYAQKNRQPKTYAPALIMAGGVLFLLSDIVLLFWLFGIGTPKEAQSFNWVLYYLAQGCLAASLSFLYPMKRF